MKRLWICLLCLALVLMPGASSLAEVTVEEDDISFRQEAAEAYVGEIEADLSTLASDEGLVSEESAVSELPDAAALAGPEDIPEGEPEAGTANDAGTEETPVAEDPIPTVKLSVSKTASKTVYLGVPYVLSVKGGIKSVKSSAAKVAKAGKDGSLTLRKKGNAKLTIQTSAGKKIVLTLKVQGLPTPDSVALKAKGGAMKLSWAAAPYATGHLVQVSPDGRSWTDWARLASGKRSLDVTDAVNGTTYFRVVAILGSALGGASEAVSALGPVTGVKVICQEDYYTGPTNRMNVTWNACPGASGYEIYHATQAAGKYSKIGTTDKTWYPVTRSNTKLDYYRVKPIFGELDLPASDPATLWTGVQSNVLPPSDLTSSSGIILLVNKKAQVVTAYVKDADGNYTVPLRHMICSTGKTYDRTRNGTYTLSSRQGEWYQYPSGCYIRWPSIYRDGYYFHSPLYKSSKKLMTDTVDKLGTRQSLGCIRLKVLDAEWIYKNCPSGTTVYICDGGSKSKLKSAVAPQNVSVRGF